MALTLSRGIYAADYGNAIVVDPVLSRDHGWDLDMGELVPLSIVTPTRIRAADDDDLARLEAGLDELGE